MDNRSGWGKARRLLACAWLAAAGLPAADAAVRSPDAATGSVARGEVDVVTGDVTTGGIVVAPGRVATLCHRLAGRESIDVVPADGRRHPARLVAGNQDRDVCIVETTELDVPAVPLTARTPETAKKAYMSGARFGRHGLVAVRACCNAWVADHGVHFGVVMSPDETAPVAPQPGAGVYDDQDRLIGMVVDRAEKTATLYMVLPVEWIATVAARMPAVDLPLETTAWMSQARAYDAAQDLDGMIRHDRAWTAARPQSTWAWNHLGNAYRASRLPDRLTLALAAYRRSVEIDPSYATGWNGLGGTYSEMGQPDRAIDAFRSGMQADPSDAVMVMNLGIVYFQRDDKAAARPLLARAVHELTGFRRAYAWDLLARAQADGPAAIGVLQDAVKVFPDDPQLWYSLGHTQYELGHMADAIGSYQHALTALKALPDNPVAIARVQGALAQAYALHDQPDQATTAMRHAVDAAPVDADYWLRRGALYMTQSNFTDALNALDRSIELNDRNAQTWVMHGTTLMQLGRYPQAATSYRRAIALDGRQADWWSALASMLNESGQPDEAMAAAGQALKLDPANRLALEATGIAAIRSNRPDAAVGIFEGMNRAYPDDAHVIANLAVAYRRTGRIDDAMQLYRRVKTLDPPLAQRLYDEELKGVATP
ncbi:serine protease [Burkholderia cepacia]|uniref:serine protease n=1 Tax=Burkholderia cepacia TaxID=292 RepID=UPI0015919E2C|nr:serine protease [Burkholderia cepacia]MBJ9749826.1 tetratricopeptide repeat protein [Burkholderia cepacia]MDC6103403.1 tetratricopeptide repeat protein [Burkholderia cepacia]